MCVKNQEEASTSESGPPQWNDISGLQNVDLVVVGVENESESASNVVQRVLGEGQNVPMKLSENVQNPLWFDAKKFQIGQHYFYKNYFAMFVAKLGGLLLTLCIPTVLQILILTGRSSTPAKAYRRYMDTIANMLDWYNGDLNKKDNDVYKVLISVRGKHCAAAKKAVTSGKGTICQRDLALTQFGFMGIAILRKDYLGMKGNSADVEGFIHFWRTIGYFMGLEDRFNICSGNVIQVTEVCTILAENFFKPLLENPTKEFIEMSDALLDGIKPVVPLYEKHGFFEFIKRQINLKPQSVTSFHGRFVVSTQVFIHTVLLTTWWLAFIFRPILNALLRFSVHCNCFKYPLLAMWILGKEVCTKQQFEIEMKDNHQQQGRLAIAGPYTMEKTHATFVTSCVYYWKNESVVNCDRDT